MDFRHSSACLTVPSLSQDTWKFVTSLLLRLTSKYQDGLVLDFRFIKRKIRLLIISATLAHGMMAIMLGGAQFLRWSGLWNLCTEQFVRNVLRRKYSCGNNTEKRRLKKMIKNGLKLKILIKKILNVKAHKRALKSKISLGLFPSPLFCPWTPCKNLTYFSNFGDSAPP